MSDLTPADCSLLIESLGFSELAVRQYKHYPDEELRQARLTEIQDVRNKVRAIRTRQRRPDLGEDQGATD